MHINVGDPKNFNFPMDIEGTQQGPMNERLSNLDTFLGAMFRLVKRVDQRSVSTLTNFILDCIRPKIPPGHQRITWVCVG